MLVALASAAAALVLADAAVARSWPPDPYPAAGAVREASEFAAEATGTVSFAVIDGDAGVRGLEEDRQFSSASVTKALLLAAELRRLRDEGEGLDDGTRSLLESMISYSDNDAASSIYARVGDEGMEEVAERAEMDSFEVTPGYWGGAQVTAADLAGFFFRLKRNLVGPDGGDAREMLADVTESQRWGIPQGTPRGWEVYFKGGWRPAGTTETSGPVTHQAALLRHRDGRRVGLAILTDLPPGETSYSILSGISRRLLEQPPPPSRWSAP